jgi:hypothetical protein
LSGDADIVPITTIKELLEEGAVMHNCVGSYAEKVKSGECYIYRVLRPERATLEISDSGDMHHINQLKLVRNGEPSAETWAKVRYWFASAIQVCYAEEFFEKHGTFSFPPPPLPGNNNIVPITTIEDLLDESAEMHNCSGSYAERIMSRECFIYRVIWPQRATLEVSDTGDMHHIRQLKLARNEEPSADTWAKVRFWFASALQGHEAA